VFLYEADGHTELLRRSRRGESTTNQHFFSELGQRIMRVCSRLGPLGRLYEIDPRLRPTGRSGILTTSLAEFARYFSEGSGQLWERQALCKARAVYGPPQAMERALEAVGQAAFGPVWRPEFAAQIADMRRRLEEASSRRNMKRGPGGMVDVEFIVQMLQLRHGREFPSIRLPNTQDALRALYQVSRLSREDFEYLSESYSFLRKVEARLRLMKSGTRGDLPEDPEELAKLSRLVGYASSASLLDDYQRYTAENRRRFQRLFGA
jgi:glutamate-ammonia-ligase adenylyltransferase